MGAGLREGKVPGLFTSPPPPPSITPPPPPPTTSLHPGLFPVSSGLLGTLDTLADPACPDSPPSVAGYDKGCWDFPDGPAVKSSHSSVGRVGSIPGWGARIPHPSWPKI